MEEKENKQENADIFRLTPIKERTLRREIHTWGHLSFRWDIQLTNGEYFEGPSGMIYKIVGANGEISTVKPGTVPSSSVKEHLQKRDTFWCDDVLMYASITSGIVNLKTRGDQDSVLHKIRKRQFRKDQQEQNLNNPKPSIKLGQKKDISDVIPFLIFDDE